MRAWRRVAGITLALAAAVAGLLAGLAVYLGVYDVSATRQHTTVVYQLLQVALHRAVKLRAADIEAPALDDPERASRGFGLFRTHCAQCHGAPGIAPEPFALGLRPEPPPLVASVRESSAAEIYWVIRQGIKMTGMPAWQYRMSDEEIWDIVAFMNVLPTLSPLDYERWSRQHAPLALTRAREAMPAPQDEGWLGDIAAGRQALQQYVCATCHVIPGIVGANSHVGPSLAGMGSRRYIAGVLPNTPANMVRWLRDPKAVDPLSAMPDLGVSEQDARDIAAFLYTLDD